MLTASLPVSGDERKPNKPFPNGAKRLRLEVMTNRISVDQRTVEAIPGFTSDQVSELVGLGLSSEPQLTALKSALLGVHACLLMPAPLTCVRDELTGLQTRLCAAQASLQRLRRGESAALWEAQIRIQQARAEHREAFQDDRWSDDSSFAESAINAVLESVGWAITDLPAEQRRARFANPEGVRHIYLGLLKGWSELQPGGAMSAFPFKPSSSPTSKFRVIVTICYAAVTGKKDADPERAIRAFIKQERDSAKRRETERAAIGRQVAEQSGLPS